jgi:hypothetical protein
MMPQNCYMCLGIGVKRLIFRSNHILRFELDTSNSTTLYGKNETIGIFLELLHIALSSSIYDIAIIFLKSSHVALFASSTCKSIVSDSNP